MSDESIPSEPTTKLFLSYARDDDETFVRCLWQNSER